MAAVLAILCILSQLGSPVALAARKKPVPSPSPSPSPKAHIRASEVRLAPLPRPSAKPPRKHGIRSTAKNPSPVALNPKPKAAGKVTPPPSAFVLSKGGKPGTLVLRFQATSRDLVLDTRAPFVVELDTIQPLKVSPSVITRSEWPKNGLQQLVLTYSGASTTKNNVILGKAAFTVCTQRTKECRKQKVPLSLTFR